MQTLANYNTVCTNYPARPGTSTTSVKYSCFKTLVKPILDYGCAVWDIESITKIKKNAGRFLTGNYTLMPGNTKINMKKLGLEPLEERRARIHYSKLEMTS